jgi:hypothetical protein
MRVNATNQSYPDCDECHMPFTSDEWDNRHTPNGNPEAEVHEGCCPDCNTTVAS